MKEEKNVCKMEENELEKEKRGKGRKMRKGEEGYVTKVV